MANKCSARDKDSNQKIHNIMESVLLNGSYAVCDAEKLVREFYKVKEAFQLSKIDIANATEEDIKHSESIF